MKHCQQQWASTEPDTIGRSSQQNSRSDRRDIATAPKLISLEFGRALAALYVCAFHGLFLSSSSQLPTVVSFMLAFGTQAVIFFFVLSGAVIRYSMDVSPKPVLVFIRARAIRLAPIYLLMVVVALGLDGLLFEQWKFDVFVGHLAFLQTQQGFICSVFRSNPALWSMSYEAWFYAMFAVAMTIPKSKSLGGWVLLSGAAVAFAAVLPNFGAIAQVTYILGYSSAWLLGYFAVDFSRFIRFDRFSTAALILAIPGCASTITPIDAPFSMLCTALLFLPWFVEQTRRRSELRVLPNVGPLIGVIVIGILCFMMFWVQLPWHRIAVRLILPAIGMACVPAGSWLCSWLIQQHGRTVETLGRCSFAIYVVHMPIIRLASRLAIPSLAQILFAIVAVALAVMILEFVFQPWAAARLKRLFPLSGHGLAGCSIKTSIPEPTAESMRRLPLRYSAADVTIAIPTLGREQVLLDTIRGCLNQAIPAGEIMIIDQTQEHEPETNGTLQDWHSSGRIRWERLPEPSLPNAMNYALSHARCPLVLFLDDDIVPDEGFIRAHAAAHDDSQAWVVVGQIIQPWQTATEVEIPEIRFGLSADLDFPFHSTRKRQIRNLMAGHMSVVREHALSVGGFDGNFRGVAYRFETEFGRRIMKSGGQLVFEPAARIRHLRAERGGTRVHGGHLTSVSPNHGVGDYYFALLEGSGVETLLYVAKRMFREVCTRFHLRHPWYIPVKLVGELRALIWALQLYSRGPKLLGRADQ